MTWHNTAVKVNSYTEYQSVPVLNMYRWCTDSWLLEIYCKNVHSNYTSYIVLSHLCKFLLHQYVLDVATISWSNLLKLMTHLKWHGDTSLLSPSAQHSKHSCHLKFIECFPWEHLLQESQQKRSHKNSGPGWHMVKSFHNCADLDSSLTWCEGQKQCSCVG